MKVRINHQIKAPELRVITAEGENLGVIKLSEAINEAQKRGFDLIEISPTAIPPVAKIMDYGKYLSQLDLGDSTVRNEVMTKCEDFVKSQNHKVNKIINCENCTGGNIKNSRNCINCFYGENFEDCGYCIGEKSKDSFYGFAGSSEVIYCTMGVASKTCYNVFTDEKGQDNVYSLYLFNGCKNCFGCVELKKKEYCILNKQYTKEEYFELAPKIIEHMKSTGEWGQPFPPKYSYNTHEESVCDLWMDPISLEEQEKRGYRTDPVKVDVPEGESVDALDLSLNIKEVSYEDLQSKKYKCSRSGQFYTFQKKEIEFYKKMKIPLPRIHWKERLFDLVRKRELIPAA